MANSQSVRTKSEEIASVLGEGAIESQWLAGDGSDRSYFRISPKGDSCQFRKEKESVVLMQLGQSDRVKLQAGTYDWVILQEFLVLHAFKVPKIVAQFRDTGELLIEDAGDNTLETCILDLNSSINSEQKILSLFSKAVDIIRSFLKIPKRNNDFWAQRAFDSQKFSAELSFFRLHFLSNAIGQKYGRSRDRIIDAEIQKLSTFLATHSKHFVHRDFHSRNLLWCDRQLAVIDFQDARIGPAAYDLVSLCFDSYVPISSSLRMRILTGAFDALERGFGLEFRAHLENTWRAMLLQRQLKALGSFAYLSLQKERGDYMKYARPAIDTLTATHLFDNRWPFLSGELLETLDRSL